MEIRESDLPGVGKRYQATTAAGEKLVLVIHNDGRRELFRFGDDPDRPRSVLELTDGEAHQVGALLAGTYFQPIAGEMVLEVMEGLHLRWLTVEADGSLDERTIRDLEIRQRTGASVIAVLREGSPIPNPSPDERLAAGDTILAIGTPEQIDRFLALAGDADASDR